MSLRQQGEKLRFLVVDAAGLAPYVSGLRELEASISYPIDDGKDRFCIDHGAHYHPFFSGMGKARFLLALAGEQVIGSMAAVWREAEVAGRRYTGLYFCDLKIAEAWRGRGLVRRMLMYVLVRWPLRRDFQGWSFVFFAAMRGESGDVGRSFRGWHLGRLLRPISCLSLYFVPLVQLCALPEVAPQAPMPELEDGVNFSPDNARAWQSTEGSKDFQLRSTGKPWQLIHFPRAPSKLADWINYLRETAQTVVQQQPNALACFGLDASWNEHQAQLSRAGLQPGANCRIYGFSLPFLGPRLAARGWSHLATSEI